jgi:hypothetical protein
MQEIDDVALSYAEIKALATGNPLIMEHCTLTAEISKLRTLQSSHMSQQYELEDSVIKWYPAQIKALEGNIAGYRTDSEKVGDVIRKDGYPMEVEGIQYSSEHKKEAGSAILAACKAMTSPESKSVGRYRGFDMDLSYNPTFNEYYMTLKGALSHNVSLGTDIFGNITRIDNVLEGLGGKLKDSEAELVSVRAQMAEAQTQMLVPFPHEKELEDKTARLAELTIALKIKDTERQVLDSVPDEGDMEPARKARERER